jgi:predicted GNAT family acetyltransferase
MVLTTCSSVVKPTLVYSLTSKNLTPAGRRVLNRFATALAGSDCTSVSFNTVVRFSRTSVAFSRGQRRLGALRNTVVTDYLVGRGVAADMLHSSVTVSNRAASINRTSFSASH